MGFCVVKFSFIVLLFVFALLMGARALADAPTVAGWVETVKIYPGGLRLNAKLDTGAKTSSLNVPKLMSYRKENRDWVRFTVKNLRGASTVIDRPIIRIARIKEFGLAIQERPVITIGVCLGTTFKETEVTLFNRTGFNLQLLLGRQFLGGSFLVDASTKRLIGAHCKDVPPM